MAQNGLSWRAELRFPRSTCSAGRARRVVAALVPEDADQRERAELLVTEAVANAVEHAAGTGLRIVLAVAEPGSLFCAVHDEDPRPPAPPVTAPGPLAESGRGLALISALSAAWGVLPDPGGKWVWFRLRSDRDAPPPPPPAEVRPARAQPARPARSPRSARSSAMV